MITEALCGAVHHKLDFVRAVQPVVLVIGILPVADVSVSAAVAMIEIIDVLFSSSACQFIHVFAIFGAAYLLNEEVAPVYCDALWVWMACEPTGNCCNLSFSQCVRHFHISTPFVSISVHTLCRLGCTWNVLSESPVVFRVDVSESLHEIVLVRRTWVIGRCIVA